MARLSASAVTEKKEVIQIHHVYLMMANAVFLVSGSIYSHLAEVTTRGKRFFSGGGAPASAVAKSRLLPDASPFLDMIQDSSSLFRWHLLTIRILFNLQRGIAQGVASLLAPKWKILDGPSLQRFCPQVSDNISRLLFRILSQKQTSDSSRSPPQRHCTQCRIWLMATNRLHAKHMIPKWHPQPHTPESTH